MAIPAMICFFIWFPPRKIIDGHPAQLIGCNPNTRHSFVSDLQSAMPAGSRE